MKKYLVTTSDERTWPKDKEQPIVFLGEWCKLYSKKEKWQSLDSKTLPYHWNDREKLYSDHQSVRATYEKTLSTLAEELNFIHQVDYSLRYWRILIGPWLWRFIQVLFDRWSMLEIAFSDNKEYYCFVTRQDCSLFVPNDMKSFIELFTKDDWNEAIYGQLITSYWANKVEITWVDREFSNLKENLDGGVKGYIKKIITFYNRLLVKDENYFFISSYLPLKTELKLQISLGQAPNIWLSESLDAVSYDNDQRQWKLNIEPSNDFEHVVEKMVPLHIPTIYIEGYEMLNTTIKKLPWPKNPKAIFTSNSHMWDDVFKAWSAKKIESGVPLVIGQHGGSYGVSLFSWSEEHEVKISDRWLSWGWFDEHRENITPIGNLKVISRNASYNPRGFALMLEWTASRYTDGINPGALASQWLDYFNDQKLFLTELSDKLQGEVLLRLYPLDFDWKQASRWRDVMPEVAIDLGTKNMRKMIQESRVLISTYNATTFLESLTWNVPTIIFWNPKHWELREQAQPYFDMLESAGIFHVTPQSAAQQMTRVWDDIDSWWKSDKVQQARNIFIEQYSATPENSLDLLRGTFEKVANEASI